MPRRLGGLLDWLQRGQAAWQFWIVIKPYLLPMGAAVIAGVWAALGHLPGSVVFALALWGFAVVLWIIRLVREPAATVAPAPTVPFERWYMRVVSLRKVAEAARSDFERRAVRHRLRELRAAIALEAARSRTPYALDPASLGEDPSFEVDDAAWNLLSEVDDVLAKMHRAWEIHNPGDNESVTFNALRERRR